MEGKDVSYTPSSCLVEQEEEGLVWAAHTIDPTSETFHQAKNKIPGQHLCLQLGEALHGGGQGGPGGAQPIAHGKSRQPTSIHLTSTIAAAPFRVQLLEEGGILIEEILAEKPFPTLSSGQPHDLLPLHHIAHEMCTTTNTAGKDGPISDCFIELVQGNSRVLLLPPLSNRSVLG